MHSISDFLSEKTHDPVKFWVLYLIFLPDILYKVSFISSSMGIYLLKYFNILILNFNIKNYLNLIFKINFDIKI